MPSRHPSIALVRTAFLTTFPHFSFNTPSFNLTTSSEIPYFFINSSAFQFQDLKPFFLVSHSAHHNFLTHLSSSISIILPKNRSKDLSLSLSNSKTPTSPRTNSSVVLLLTLNV